MLQALSTSLPLKGPKPSRELDAPETNWRVDASDFRQLDRTSSKRTGRPNPMKKIGIILKTLKRFIRWHGRSRLQWQRAQESETNWRGDVIDLMQVARISGKRIGRPKLLKEKGMILEMPKLFVRLTTLPNNELRIPSGGFE
jgi:hypothetical protein